MTRESGVLDAKPLPVHQMFPSTRYFEIDSVKAGARYAVWITTPPGYNKATEQHFPAVYMPDGNRAIMLSASVVSAGPMEDIFSPLKPSLQICVGYVGKEAEQYLAVRARDLLPPKEYLLPGAVEGLRSYGLGALGDQEMANLYADHLENPASDRFLAFLSEELHPIVAQLYRVKPDELGLFGHSYGGLFVSYASLQKATIFKYFGASSPGILAQHSKIFELYYEALASGGLSERALHMTLGTRELTDATVYQTLCGAGTVEFMRAARTTPLPGLTFTSKLFERETHMSVEWPAFWDFLRTFYGGGA